MICLSAFTEEEYESYVSSDYNEEKTLKAMKMLLAGHPIRMNPEERYALFVTEIGGFDIGLVYNNDSFLGTGISLSNFTAEINKLDEKDLDDQFAMFCVSQSLKPKKRI